ncbi:hypothetical protein [Streptomyces sp. NRRL S-350]|uniref:hypothetical protein n=1 Tax=Streptomyces sp. NRRL S-350 TaxID=1463902 RepID=UPI0004BE8F9E|nr:hypothetical protein [Streptomyces sp. NRRL S-350]
MDTVIVLEPDTPTNVRLLGPDRTPADPENPVRRAHTAPAEPSGACGPLTLCGLDTSDMTLAPHRSTDPGHPRPPWQTCSTCRTAEQRAAPRAPEPAAADSTEDDTAPAGHSAS